MPDPLARARELLQDADALLITAGAGIGVDSGLPDFRGSSGFWRAYPAAKARGLRFEQLANPDWFRRDPQLAWAFYGHRLNLYRATMPHAGFTRLLDFANSLRGGYGVLTSNVDGQFQAARFDPARLYEVHGSIHHLQCSRPCTDRVWVADDIVVRVDMARFVAEPPLPVCPDCGAVARPNVLMFGDGDWLPQRSDGQAQRLQAWLDSDAQRARRSVVLELGAGTAVPTVRRASEQLARRLSTALVRINPRDDALPAGPHVALRLGAHEALEALLPR